MTKHNFIMSWRKLLVPIVLAVVGSTAKVSAAPAEIFTPYLDQIRQNLPPSLAVRLPSQIRLGGTADTEFINNLIVRVYTSATPPGVTVGLFTCRTGPQPCLIGTFSAESKNSANAMRELKKHQSAKSVISLKPDVKGYLLEGVFSNPSTPFSSMMWQQDGMIYTISFLAEERQNILFMAYSMANESPIRRVNVPARVLNRF